MLIPEDHLRVRPRLGRLARNLVALQPCADATCTFRRVVEIVGARHTQTGRFWLDSINTELFFVTLDKSEKAFSPSTRYEDFAVSPTRFHWQSQSTTGENSPTGQRYQRQRDNGARFLMFVRPKRGDPFLFLGPLRYVSHSGSRPMSIYWDLEYPMPAWFFEICASLRAA